MPSVHSQSGERTGCSWAVRPVPKQAQYFTRSLKLAKQMTLNHINIYAQCCIVYVSVLPRKIIVSRYLSESYPRKVFSQVKKEVETNKLEIENNKSFSNRK